MPTAGAEVTPYWRRLPAFLGYPFKGKGKWALISLTAATSVLVPLVAIFVPFFVSFVVVLRFTSGLETDALRGPLLELIVRAPLWLSDIGLALLLINIGLVSIAIFIPVANYGFTVFSLTASGSTQPPSAQHAFTSGYRKTLKLLLLLAIVVWGLSAVLTPMPMATGIRVVMLILGVMALLPAATILLATTGHLRHAINPWRLTASIRRLGLHYLVLMALIVSLCITVSLLLGLLGSLLKELLIAFEGDLLPGFLLWTLWGLAWAYLASAIFHVLGYFAWQYGLPDTDGDGETEPPGGPEARATSAAPEVTTSPAAGAPSDFETLIRRHIDGGRTSMAAQVLIDARRNDPGYRPAYPDAYLPLATELRATGRPEIAIRLCNGFHKRFPGHSNIPALYELIASIYSDDLGQPEYACSIRNFLRHYHD